MYRYVQHFLRDAARSKFISERFAVIGPINFSLQPLRPASIFTIFESLHVQVRKKIDFTVLTDFFASCLDGKLSLTEPLENTTGFKPASTWDGGILATDLRFSKLCR
jgi:hypothetical protein